MHWKAIWWASFSICAWIVIKYTWTGCELIGIKFRLSEFSKKPLFSKYSYSKISTYVLHPLVHLDTAISQNTLTSDDYWRNKICILLRLDVVDDVNLNTKAVLESFIALLLIWFSCRFILSKPFSVNSQTSIWTIIKLIRACGNF